MTEGEEEEAWEGANQANDLNLEAEHGLFLTHTHTCLVTESETAQMEGEKNDPKTRQGYELNLYVRTEGLPEMCTHNKWIKNTSLPLLIPHSHISHSFTQQPFSAVHPVWKPFKPALSLPSHCALYLSCLCSYSVSCFLHLIFSLFPPSLALHFVLS